MSIRNFTKSGSFVAIVLVLVVALLPFAIEQIGEATGLFAFHPTKRIKAFFSSGSSAKSSRAAGKIDWQSQLADIEAFSNWAEGLSEAKISIVRPEVFQVERADANPATSSRFSWRLRLISDRLDISATQVRNKLEVLCEPESAISARIASVKPLPGGEKGFLVTADDVSGEGKVGLSYAGLPPIYYDVKLRRIWLVPVAACRASMRGRYDAEVYFPGVKQGLPEGGIISPSSEKCGYRVVSISDNCVWFEAFYGEVPLEDEIPRSIWPDFSRIDTLPPTPPPGRLVFGRSRCFWPGDAIKLPNSGTYLMVDTFLGSRAVVFRLLDSAMRPVRELLCVIVHEKK